MGALIAILQSDPNLLRCQLQRLDGHVALYEPERLPDAYGFGYYRGNDVLLGKRPSGSPRPFRLAQLAATVASEALLAQGRYATIGGQKDENTQPFRFRRWLFAHDGTVEAFREVKPRLVAWLPEFLRRSLEGETDSEHAFMVFLKYMKDSGKLDDLDADAAAVGRALASSIRDLDRWSREAGATRPSCLNFVATNGRVLAAVRRGRPLHYALLEGIVPCAHHGLDATASENDPQLKPHRRVKAVCFATHLLQRNGFLDVPDGCVATVSRSLQLTVSSLGSL